MKAGGGGPGRAVSVAEDVPAGRVEIEACETTIRLDDDTNGRLTTIM